MVRALFVIMTHNQAEMTRQLTNNINTNTFACHNGVSLDTSCKPCSVPKCLQQIMTFCRIKIKYQMFSCFRYFSCIDFICLWIKMWQLLFAKFSQSFHEQIIASGFNITFQLMLFIEISACWVCLFIETTQCRLINRSLIEVLSKLVTCLTTSEGVLFYCP